MSERASELMPAGYSGTPLPKKLGVKSGHLFILVGSPESWGGDWPETYGALPDAVRVVADGRRGNADVILAFFIEAGRLRKRLDGLKRRIRRDGALWIAWPKRASKVRTDITEDVVREVGLSNGLVDIKVCAVDEVWSGLKLVYRLRDRR